MDDQAFDRSLEEALKRRWGEKYPVYLPLIWEQDFDQDLQAQVRFDYMDALTRLVQENFSMQVGNWCREHGVEYIGHLIEDSHQHTRTASSLGHYFRGLRGQDMAGIDDIGGQVLPQGENIGPGDPIHPVRDGEFFHYELGKLGASLAAIDPLKKGRGLCEIFGNYGWKEGVRLEKYLADHFLVRGINYFVPHAFSAKEFPDPDCPPHFYAHGHNPQYRHFGALMAYMNRVSSLISDGQSVTPAAILYSAEADWCGECMYLQKPAIQLYDHQIDYHFIPADVFTEASYYRTALGKVLRINGQEYRALIIPETEYIPRAAVAAVSELHHSGCKVLFVNSRPCGTCEGGRQDPLLAELEGVRVVRLDELSAILKAEVVS